MTGPTATTQHYCGLCKYHQQEMLCSGLNPVYRHTCGHPDLESPLETSPEGLTPSWCPVLPGKIGRRCDKCLHWRHIGAPQNNGRCAFPVPDNLPEWVHKASTSMRRSAGRECRVWAAALNAGREGGAK